MTEDQHKDFKTRLRESGAPKRHRLWELCSKHPDWTKTLADILNTRYGTGFLIALLGPRGTGKTQLGVELIKHALMQEHSAQYVRAMDIFITLKSTYGHQDRSGANERTVLAALAEPRLLVIDELSERSDNEWENRMLTYLIDVRYGEKLDTLLISNADLTIGDSVLSRLNETGGQKRCAWPSFRG